MKILFLPTTVEVVHGQHTETEVVQWLALAVLLRAAV